MMETQTDTSGQAANTSPDAAAIARLAEQQRQTADAARSTKDAQAAEQQARSAELDRLQRDKATLAAEVGAATAREQMLREQLANTARERADAIFMPRLIGGGQQVRDQPVDAILEQRLDLADTDILPLHFGLIAMCG